MTGTKSGMRISPVKEESCAPIIVFFLGSSIVLFTVALFLIGTYLGDY